MHKPLRTFLLGLLLLLLLSPAWSQSLLSQATFGLFTNPFDAASSVSDAGLKPTFSNLGRNYFFGSLANFYNLPTGSSVSGVPVTLGLYKATPRPMSAFGTLFADTTASTLSNGITPTTASKNVTVGTETTTHVWITAQTDNEYTCLQAWDLYTDALLLLALGGLNLGVSLDAQFEQNVSGAAINTWVGNNSTSVFTDFYDTAGVGVVPAPAQNYTLTTVESDPDTEFLASLAVPIFLPRPGRGLEAMLDVAYNSRDQSTSLTEQYTAPQQAGVGSFNAVTTEDSVEDKTGYVDADLDAILTASPFFGAHADNRVEIGLDGGVQFNTAADLVTTVIIQDFDYAGGGAPLVLTDNGFTTDDLTTTTRKGTVAYDVHASLQHFFYFDLGSGATWGLAPRARIGITYTPSVSTYDVEDVTVSKTDGNGDGLFNNALDTITTTTVTYYDNADGGNFDWDYNINLPMALTFRPNNGPVGFMAGAEVGIDFTVRTVKDTPQTTRTEITWVDGTGTVLNPPIDIITAPTSYERTRLSTPWDFNAELAFGVNFYLPGDATLDIVVKGAFWNDRVEIQATIPLK